MAGQPVDKGNDLATALRSQRVSVPLSHDDAAADGRVAGQLATSGVAAVRPHSARSTEGARAESGGEAVV